jgi:hypothetical protein
MLMGAETTGSVALRPGVWACRPHPVARDIQSATIAPAPHCQSTEVRCIGRVERSGTISFFARPWLSGLAPAYTDSS